MKNNKNPNSLVKELKRKYGPQFNYSFLEYDNLQREFYMMNKRAEEKKARKDNK